MDGSSAGREAVREARLRRGLTQEKLAERAKVSVSTVQRLEEGRPVRPSSAALLARALGCSQAELGLLPRGRVGSRSFGGRRHAARGDNDVNRHQFLARSGAALAGALLSRVQLDTERLTAVVAGDSHADQPLLDDLLLITRGYARQQGSLAPALLLPAVRGHLGMLHRLLGGGPPAAVAGRLHSLTSETAALTAWLSYRAQNLGDADRYYAEARRLATAVGDGPRLAYALGSQSWMVSGVPRGDRAGPGPQALTLLRAATAAAGPAGPAPLLGMLWARRAEEHAIAGEATAADRALERAESAVSVVRAPDDGLLSNIGPAWLAGYRGSCAVLLRRPAAAVAALEEALARGLLDRGQRAAVRTDLAVAHAEQGDVERACALLADALAVTGSGEWRDQLPRVVGARRRLARWANTPSVARLDEQLQAHLLLA